MSTELGLEKLPSLCPGGETISITRLLHYLPYRNDSHGSDCDSASTLNGSDGSVDNGKQVLSGSNRGFPSCLLRFFVEGRKCVLLFWYNCLFWPTADDSGICVWVRGLCAFDSRWKRSDQARTLTGEGACLGFDAVNCFTPTRLNTFPALHSREIFCG